MRDRWAPGDDTSPLVRVGFRPWNRPYAWCYTGTNRRTSPSSDTDRGWGRHERPGSGPSTAARCRVSTTQPITAGGGCSATPGITTPAGTRRVSERRSREGPDPFLLQLERLLVVLLGQLEPDEQPGQHDERDHDERAER